MRSLELRAMPSSCGLFAMSCRTSTCSFLASSCTGAFENVSVTVQAFHSTELWTCSSVLVVGLDEKQSACGQFNGTVGGLCCGCGSGEVREGAADGRIPSP